MKRSVRLFFSLLSFSDEPILQDLWPSPGINGKNGSFSLLKGGRRANNGFSGTIFFLKSQTFRGLRGDYKYIPDGN